MWYTKYCDTTRIFLGQLKKYLDYYSIITITYHSGQFTLFQRMTLHFSVFFLVSNSQFRLRDDWKDLTDMELELA